MKVVHGYISDYVRGLEATKLVSGLNPLKKLVFMVLGVVRVEKVYVKTPEGAEGVSEVYLARCPYCKSIYVDYPHGYSRYIQCPKCRTRIYV